MTTHEAQVIKRSTEAVGVREEATNWGKWVSVYLKFVGWFKPAPWCCAFVCFKVHQAAKDIGMKSRFPKTAGCDALYAWAKKNGRVLTSPKPGCIFLVGDHSDYTHTGIVVGLFGNGKYVNTVEGNSNNTGSREGTAVVTNTRKAASLTFIDLA